MQGFLLVDPIHEVDDAGWPHVKRGGRPRAEGKQCRCRHRRATPSIVGERTGTSASTYFDELLARTAEAGHRQDFIERDYRIAGRSVRLRWTGLALAAALTRAFAHLASGPADEPSLTVYRAEGGVVTLPHPPWELLDRTPSLPSPATGPRRTGRHQPCRLSAGRPRMRWGRSARPALSSGIAGAAGRSTRRDLASESSTVPDSHSTRGGPSRTPVEEASQVQMVGVRPPRRLRGTGSGGSRK